MNQEWKKRFQRRFGIFWSKVPSGNIIGYVDPNDNRPIIVNQDSILAFIQSEIDLALANRNKEIVEEIEGIKIPKENYKKVVNGKTSTNPEYMGYNLALQDIINLITKDNE